MQRDEHIIAFSITFLQHQIIHSLLHCQPY